MTESLYNKVTYQCSQLITQRYSTSFSLGIRTLDKAYHQPIYAIYGFVRLADEIVDTFHQYDKTSLINRFEADTYQAIAEGISLNPVLHAFQDVVNRYNIPFSFIDAFLHSMKMDLTHSHYDSPEFQEYVYGSAEVVGLMCLKIFCQGDETRYQQLEPAACKLGAAFQKVNFLRDLRSDYWERGRMYFPDVAIEQFDNYTKQQIEADIEEDFDEAYQGILNLNVGARLGVYVAYVYYRCLFQKIQRLPASEVLSKRVRIPDSKKAYLMLESYVKNTLNYI
jgi:phytoene/squalene synthetase